MAHVSRDWSGRGTRTGRTAATRCRSGRRARTDRASRSRACGRTEAVRTRARRRPPAGPAPRRTTSAVRRRSCSGCSASGRRRRPTARRAPPTTSGRSRRRRRSWTSAARECRSRGTAAFTRGNWAKGMQPVSYSVLDNVGVRLVRPVAGRARTAQTLPCDFARRVPCANGLGRVPIDTSELLEGTQPLTLLAEDAAGNQGLSTAITVRVDRTAPGAVAPTLAGGAVWRNSNDFDLAWTNPVEVDRAPIAGVHYRLCRVGPGGCISGYRPGVSIAALPNLAVPSPGHWQLRLWRVDAAGNTQPENASLPLPLLFDPEPPSLGFERQPGSDPTQVAALVTDRISGLASGAIELSVQGSGVWRTLPTVHRGSRLVAHIDDAHLPPGPYVLRATARDHAGNQASSATRLDGRPMSLVLPLRTPTTVQADVARRRHKRRAAGAEAVVRLGHRFAVNGTLRVQRGGSIGPARIIVLWSTGSSPEQVVDTVDTDRRGRFTYRTRARATGSLRLAYAGSATTLPSEARVGLKVPAATSVHARPRSLRNGRVVTFRGSVLSRPVPTTGKLLELQVMLSGHWQTFRTLRTGPNGRWRVRYRFRRTCGVLVYRFRARLPAEAGYSFETGATKPVTVRVRGPRCG